MTNSDHTPNHAVFVPANGGTSVPAAQELITRIIASEHFGNVVHRSCWDGLFDPTAGADPLATHEPTADEIPEIQPKGS